jgi:Uma2 family endonuclease
MAAHPSPLSNEEFHRLYDGAKPAYEYWFDAAVQKPMPTLLHSLVQSILVIVLRKAGWNAAVEVRLKVVREAEPVPDRGAREISGILSPDGAGTVRRNSLTGR